MFRYMRVPSRNAMVFVTCSTSAGRPETTVATPAAGASPFPLNW
jgi:hypothetical protein